MSVKYEKIANVIIGKRKDDLIYQILKHENVYSLLVIMKDSHGLDDFVFIYDITDEESVAEEILRILSENAVTPCTVKDVLEDLFSELDFHHA